MHECLHEAFNNCSKLRKYILESIRHGAIPIRGFGSSIIRGGRAVCYLAGHTVTGKSSGVFINN